MKDLLISPLAPAFLLLAGAFIMTILPRLFPGVKRSTLSYFCLFITGAVFLVLASRISLRLISGFADPPLALAPWGSGEAMTLRLDGMSMAFLFIPVLLLIASFLAQKITDYAMLLWLTGAAALVFVAANGISFSYALLFFDVLGCFYWVQNGRVRLALARLFLSVVTTAALMLAGLPATAALGGALLAITLLVRIGLFPFAENSALTGPKLTETQTMVWFALSTAVGVYVTARFLTAPVPAAVQIGMAIIILLTAVLAWLGEAEGEKMRVKLLRMGATQPGLALLITPLPATVAIALVLGYTLSLGALWLMPPVGKPDFFERHWLWIYGTPVLATLSLAGFPFTLGWLAHLGVYSNLLLHNQQILLAVIILSEGIAFSVLYHYWQQLLAGKEKTEIALFTALIPTIPFLLPGVAGLVFSVITGLPFSAGAQAQAMAGTVAINLALVWVLAATLGYGRERILRWLGLSPQAIEPALLLSWTGPYAEAGIGLAGKGILRLKSIFEGTHYLGWAFLIALAGILVMVLS